MLLTDDSVAAAGDYDMNFKVLKQRSKELDRCGCSHGVNLT